MKLALLALVLGFASIASAADPQTIVLQAGSSISLTPYVSTVIRCEGASLEAVKTSCICAANSANHNNADLTLLALSATGDVKSTVLVTYGNATYFSANLDACENAAKANAFCK